MPSTAKGTGSVNKNWASNAFYWRGSGSTLDRDGGWWTPQEPRLRRPSLFLGVESVRSSSRDYLAKGRSRTLLDVGYGGPEVGVPELSVIFVNFVISARYLLGLVVTKSMNLSTISGMGARRGVGFVMLVLAVVFFGFTFVPGSFGLPILPAFVCLIYGVIALRP